MKTAFFSSLLFLSLAATLTAQNNRRAVAVVQAYFESVDAGQVDAVAELCAADFQASAPFLPQAVPLSAWKNVGAGFKASFPDMKHEVVDWCVDGGKVAVRGVFHGTNTGPMQGNPATGNRVDLSFNSFFVLDKQLKIKALYIQFDHQQFQQQLMAGLPDARVRTEANLRALFAAMDQGQVDRFNRYCRPEFLISHPQLPVPAPLATFQGIIQGQKAGFPDMRHEIVDLYTDGRKATIRGIFHGTNTGPLQGNAPTGRTVHLPFLVSYDLDEQGLIIHQYVYFDAGAFGQQLMGSPVSTTKN